MLQKFCDGEFVFKEFTKEYVVHPKGLFIVAPSGSGKTHFMKRQKEKDWIDGDVIWTATGAHPTTAWWNESLEVIFEINEKSDIITSQARKLGLWIMGASNAWLVPDAIILPDWKTHQHYIQEREKNNYDGGATSRDFAKVFAHRGDLKKFARKNHVKIFKTVEEAVEHLTKS